MERTTFCLLFYIRRTKLNRNGEAPIMMRITVNGVRVDASVKKTILPEFWSAAKGKALEKKREYKELNLYLDSIRLRIMKIQRELEIEEVSVSANSVLDRFQGKDAPVQHTLFEVFREHNDKCVQLSGTDMAPATVQRYETSLKHTRDFVWETYHKKDVLLDEISRQFIEDYEFWLKTEKKCCHNTATKYLKNFKKIIRIALAKGWMKNDPFLEIRFSLDKVEPDFLNKKRILIIEDDGDVRKFLETELGIYFEIISEPDGLSGLQKAQSFEVDLIICDVLMPGMNGFDVTRKLKRDFETSHIPIILLTAMSTSENKLEGVESGADAYITKPFSSRLLLARIFQLIEQREKLKRKFSNDPAMTSQALCSTELDRKFGEKLQTILEKQLDNPEFTIEDFASAVGVSRAAFFRKVKGVTGYTPNEYMRILRMKRAMELLQEGIYNVSEIAYKVGMNDPLYFSKCFKSHFGAPPSAYLHKK